MVDTVEDRAGPARRGEPGLVMVFSVDRPAHKAFLVGGRSLAFGGQCADGSNT